MTNITLDTSSIKNLIHTWIIKVYESVINITIKVSSHEDSVSTLKVLLTSLLIWKPKIIYWMKAN